MQMQEPRYEHVQHGRSWRLYIAFAIVAAFCFFGIVGPLAPPEARPGVWMLGIFCCVCPVTLGLFFSQMSIRDEGDGLKLQLGVLPLFKKRIPYDRIKSVERMQFSAVDIHWLGWPFYQATIWKVSGSEGIELSLRRGKIFRFGTDDPEHLNEFLETAILHDKNRPRGRIHT